MKDFNDFKKYIKENSDAIIDNISNGLPDIPKNERTISKQEWEFIQKDIIKANIELLNQYHEWLHK